MASSIAVIAVSTVGLMLPSGDWYGV
jgi:hypothetical protein